MKIHYFRQIILFKVREPQLSLDIKYVVFLSLKGEVAFASRQYLRDSGCWDAHIVPFTLLRRNCLKFKIKKQANKKNWSAGDGGALLWSK